MLVDKMLVDQMFADEMPANEMLLLAYIAVLTNFNRHFHSPSASGKI
jgi:hypothetical protein